MTIPIITEPDMPGAFVGDIWFGHPEMRSMGTHRWNGHKWEVLPSEIETLMILLAQARAKPDLDAMANRFLGWQVPASVVSDRCMSEAGYKFPRSGTCIMGPAEARQMLEYLFQPQN